MIKRFLGWIGLKERIHHSSHIPPLFKEGEVWWCHMGENIGIEVNGKGEHFTRPVFIFKKYDKYSFLGLPLTTKTKTGSWYSPVIFGGKNQTIVLAQGKVCDYRRFKEKMGELEEKETEKVREAYAQLHTSRPPKKNRPPVLSDGSRG